MPVAKASVVGMRSIARYFYKRDPNPAERSAIAADMNIYRSFNPLTKSQPTGSKGAKGAAKRRNDKTRNAAARGIRSRQTQINKQQTKAGVSEMKKQKFLNDTKTGELADEYKGMSSNERYGWKR